MRRTRPSLLKRPDWVPAGVGVRCPVARLRPFSMLLLLFVLVSPTARTAADDALTRALADEMNRSIERLSVADQPGPYFVSYRVEDIETTQVAATFGSLLTSSRKRGRYLNAEVRVGSPQLDNTNFFFFPTRTTDLARSVNGWVTLPLTDDYRELRRQAWLVTDSAYKTALAHLARKTAALQNRQQNQSLRDLAPEAPAVIESDSELAVVDLPIVEELVRDLSAVFRRHPAVLSSEVELRATRLRTRYLNSEGSRSRTSTVLVSLRARAEGHAVDGRRLEDAAGFFGRGLDDLPPRDELLQAVEKMGERLAAAQTADLIERYNGPVLFEDQAAAEIFLQSFAPRLAGFRRPVSEEERIEQSLAQLSGGFNDRLGGRVLPRFARLVDDPTLMDHGGHQLVGGFSVDHEGVPARPTRLVERGILKTLLSSRNPSPGVEASTGSRRGVGTAPSNLVLTASESRSPAELKRELLLLMEERELDFGVVVRRIANPTLLATRDRAGRRRSGFGRGRESSVTGVVEAVRVDREGRETQLRNVEIAGLGPTSFKDVVAVSERSTVYSAPLRAGQQIVPGGQGLAPEAVSAVVPSLLFEELTLKTSEGPIPKPPVAAHPYFSESR